MVLKPPDVENVILQSEFEQAAEHDAVYRVCIYDAGEFYFVVCNLKSAKRRNRYMITRRDKLAQKYRLRQFKDLRLLRNILKSIVHTDVIELHLDEAVPANVVNKQSKKR